MTARKRERERERERTFERARESARILPQIRPAHHIVSARQAYAHRPCVLRPGHPLPLRPSETLQRSPDVDAPPPRPRRHRVHPSARHPRPLDPGPRMPPPQRRRVPARHRTVPRPRAWDARASTVIGATAARPRAPKPSRRKRPAAPQPATAATHSPQPPPRPPPERRRAEPPSHARKAHHGLPCHSLLARGASLLLAAPCRCDTHFHQIPQAGHWGPHASSSDDVARRICSNISLLKGSQHCGVVGSWTFRGLLGSTSAFRC